MGILYIIIDAYAINRAYQNYNTCVTINEKYCGGGAMFRYKIDVTAALKKAGLNYYQSRKKDTPISQGTFTRLKKCQSVSLSTLDAVCQILHCQLSDLIEILPDEEMSNGLQE